MVNEQECVNVPEQQCTTVNEQVIFTKICLSHHSENHFKTEKELRTKISKNCISESISWHNLHLKNKVENIGHACPHLSRNANDSYVRGARGLNLWTK